MRSQVRTEPFLFEFQSSKYRPLQTICQKILFDQFAKYFSLVNECDKVFTCCERIPDYALSTGTCEIGQIFIKSVSVDMNRSKMVGKKIDKYFQGQSLAFQDKTSILTRSKGNFSHIFDQKMRIFQLSSFFSSQKVTETESVILQCKLT